VAGRAGRLGLAPRGDVGVFELGLELARAISVVPVHFRPHLVRRAGVVFAAAVFAAGISGVEEVVDELGGDAGVPGVAGRDHGGGDDLAVGVDGHMALIAVEPPGRGLMAMAGVGVDDRDHPVLGHFAGDAENAVVTGFDVLADHGGQQLRHRGDAGAERAAVEDGQAGVRIFGQFVDQAFTGGGIVPVTARFAPTGIVVVAAQYRPQLSLQASVDDVEQLTYGGADHGD